MVGVRGRFLGRLEEEGGVIIALVAFMMLGLLGFLALAVDLGHLYMVRNELQNAADAGALAGASVLYNANATQVNVGANQVAYDTATANRASILPSGWSAVQVNWTSGTNDGDVQRGHYDYSNATDPFTPNAAIDPPILAGGSEASLNADTNFINAVRVITRTSTGSLFASLLSISTSDLSAEAIAYVGFAKQFNPRDAEQPIGICQDWLNNACTNWPNNHYRMVPDPGPTNQVAHWMTLNQASNPQADISCGATLVGNRDILPFDGAMDVSTIASNLPVLDVFRDHNWDSSTRCAMNDSDNDGTRDEPIDSDADGAPDRPWVLSLPVIDCTANPMSAPPLGRVKVEIIWITPSGTPSDVCTSAPNQMGGWTFAGPEPGCEYLCTVLPYSCTWCSFATQFGLKDYSGQTLMYCDPASVWPLLPPPPPPMPPDLQRVMFIKPVCETVNGTPQPVRPPTGPTGSSIYPLGQAGQRGQLAKYPVLVK